MEFIDLKAQRDRIRDKLESNIQSVLDHCRFIMGPEVFELEKKLASFVGVKHAISCGSGTDALLMALMAYDVGPGDVILTTPFSFASTAEVIVCWERPRCSWTSSPTATIFPPKKLDRCIRVINGEIAPEGRHPFPTLSSRPDHKIKGVISVDIFGLPADFDPIRKIADDHGLFLIEDAAQSFGAEYKDKKACSMGDIACTSFFPAKPLGCYGDGGMCFTDDDAWADVLQSVRIHGKGSDKYDNVRIGINGRMDTLQAAVLLAKFDIFPEEIEKRQPVAKRYTDLLTEKCPSIVPPQSSRRQFVRLGAVFDPDEKSGTQDRRSIGTEGNRGPDGDLLPPAPSPSNGLPGPGTHKRRLSGQRGLFAAHHESSHASVFA